jgi:glucose dehydrogenase
VQLIPRADYADVKARNPGKEVSPQAGTPFGMVRQFVASPFGAPCNKPPWGTLAALDLNRRTLLWEVPLGTTEERLPFGIALKTGMPNIGGPVDDRERARLHRRGRRSLPARLRCAERRRGVARPPSRRRQRQRR